jgi:hypothetical protein
VGDWRGYWADARGELICDIWKSVGGVEMVEILKQQAGTLMAFAIICVILIAVCKLTKNFIVGKNDRGYKEYNREGQLIKEGYKRPIWDYNLFPGLSKVWHMGEWAIPIAVGMLLVLIVLYLCTKDVLFGDLVKVNIGVVFGMLVRRAKKSE